MLVILPGNTLCGNFSRKDAKENPRKGAKKKKNL
jgi:hypothetical protein